jgi:FkbM family methyltransferase
MRKLIKKFLIRVGAYKFIRHIEQLKNAYFLKVHEDDYFKLPSSINGGTIADVGGNLGQSLISFRKLFPQSEIHSYEPNPVCIPTLKKVAAIVGGKIEVINIGVGDCKKSLEFFVPILDNGVEILQEGSFQIDAFKRKDTKNRIGSNFSLKKSIIPVISLDDLNFSYDLIKIDVQGLEFDVLKGAVNI